MRKPTPREKDHVEKLMVDIYDYCSETGASYDDPTEIITKLVTEISDLKEELADRDTLISDLKEELADRDTLIATYRLDMNS